MAQDGIFLNVLKAELEEALCGLRVEKIFQPTREELILSFRAHKESRRLLISAKPQAARAHLTASTPENPKEPPMFCMLLRKTLGSARLTAIRQPSFERVLCFDFDTVNEFGDRVTATICAELMGRNSNIILLNEENKIIDAVRRVGADKSSVRHVLPGLLYQLPPPMDKISVADWAQVVEKVRQSTREAVAEKLLNEVLEGASPLLCREPADRAGILGISRSELKDSDFAALSNVMRAFSQAVLQREAMPLMLLEEGVPKDFYWTDITQYGTALEKKQLETLSQLLDGFFGEKDESDRMRQKMAGMLKTLGSRIERIERKLSAQRQELLQCRDREEMKIKGDLLSSSLHLLQKGMSEAKIFNYYDPEGAELVIKLDAKLTPNQNAQKYYRDYRRAATAEKMLVELIESAEGELFYLESVFDLMMRATTEAELQAVREELSREGYLKSEARKKQKSVALSPFCYRSSDGFLIFSGRNNLQNDRLTLKDSRREDIWFHTQKIPGSHTVIITEGRQVPDQTLTEAAVIAATNSRARDSKKVPVDYTFIRNVKKQPNAKPGMVIYDNFKTAFVDPDPDLCDRLLKNATH